MHCSNCGKPMEGQFCGECGARNEPTTGLGEQFVAPQKKSRLTLILSLVLAVLVIVFSGVAIGQNAMANSHKALALNAAAKGSYALSQVTYYEDLAASNRSLASADEVYKTSCYYNVWCSVATYRSWINLINMLNDNAAEDDAKAVEWKTTANNWAITESSQRSQQKASEIARGVSIGFAIASALGLVVFNIVRASRKRKALAA
ncbi:MAG: hypothetical protein RL488_409 [Actinomycetota bacterium]